MNYARTSSGNALTTMEIGNRQLDTALEYLERYLPTLEPNDIRTIQQILAAATFERKQPTGPLRQPSRKKGLVKHFKAAMKASRGTHAMEYLRTRTLTTWSAAPTDTWMQALTNLHPRLCGPIPRNCYGGPSEAKATAGSGATAHASVAAADSQTPTPTARHKHH